MSAAASPAGYNVTAITTDEEGGFTTTWSDGRDVGPTNSIEQAIIYRQRARSIATFVMLKRKRRLWPIPRI